MPRGPAGGAASRLLLRPPFFSSNLSCLPAALPAGPRDFGGTYDTKSTTQAAPDPDGPPFAPWCAADGRSGGLHHGGPGCHNESVCRAWAEFTAANEARRARDLAAFRAENDWSSVRIRERSGGGRPGRSREAPAVVIDLDALELPDCAGCGEKSKRVRCRTMDLDGPGRTGAIYTCRNVRCRKRREVIGRYFLRREMYGDH